MPIGSTNVYNPGDLILSTVSGSGTSFIETKIIAATSSFILFNSSGTLTSASLNSIVATTSSYVSGSTSIITNLTASNISAIGTGSFGMVGIGTTSPAAKLDVSANAVDIAIFRSSGGLANDKRLTITSGGEKVIFNVSDNSNTAIARAYEFQNAGTASMTLNSTGSLQVVNTGRIIGIIRASSTPQTTFYDNTFAVNSDGGGANGFIYTSGTGGTFPLDFYGELIIQAGPRTGYNNGISLVTGTTSPSVKLRVAENGNVGIGTTLPGALLEISSSTAASLLNIKGAGGNGILFVSGSGFVGIGTTSPSYKLDVSGSSRHGYRAADTHQFTGSVNISGSVTFSGPIIYDNAVLLDYGNVSTPVVSTNYVVLQNLTGSYNSAFFDYFASSGSNFRAGTVIAGWSGNNVNYTEYSTTDVGNTNQLSMSVDLSGSFVRLLTTVSTTINWNIKTAGRYL